MSLLAKNIKQIRLNSELTQLQFGKKYGLSRFNVSSYEDGRAKPPVEVLIAIAKEVETTVEGLFNNIIEEKKANDEDDESVQAEVESDDNLVKGVEEKEMPPIANLEYFPSSLFDEPEVVLPNTESEQNNTASFERRKEDISQKEGFESKVTTSSHFEKTEESFPKKEVSFIKKTKETFIPPTQSDEIGNNEAYLGIQSVALIKSRKAYESNYNNPDWLAKLPHMHIPLYQKGEFIAFEDKESWFACKQVSNWFNISDGLHCFVLAKGHGLIYRKVYNELKLKGEFLLSSLKEGDPVIALGLRDAIEIWEVVAQINYGKPVTSPSFNKIEEIVEDLKLEIFRLSK